MPCPGGSHPDPQRAAGYKGPLRFTFGRDGYTYTSSTASGEPWDHALVSPIPLRAQVETGLGVWPCERERARRFWTTTPTSKSPDHCRRLFAPDRTGTRTMTGDRGGGAGAQGAAILSPSLGFLSRSRSSPGRMWPGPGLPPGAVSGCGPRGWMSRTGLPRNVSAATLRKRTQNRPEGKQPGVEAVLQPLLGPLWPLVVQTEREWSGSCQDSPESLRGRDGERPGRASASGRACSMLRLVSCSRSPVRPEVGGGAAPGGATRRLSRKLRLASQSG